MACMAAMHERRRVCGRVPLAYGVMPRERPGVGPGEGILSAPRPVRWFRWLDTKCSAPRPVRWFR